MAGRGVGDGVDSGIYDEVEIGDGEIFELEFGGEVGYEYVSTVG